MQPRTRAIHDSRRAGARLCWFVLVIAFLPACRSAPLGGFGATSLEALTTPADIDAKTTDSAEATDTTASETSNQRDAPDAADSTTVAIGDTDSDAAATPTRYESVAETVRSARERIGSWDEQPSAASIELTNDGWRHATSPEDTVGPARSPQTGTGPEPRWRNTAIDDWLATSPARRADMRHLLGDENPTVRGNAAIALARSGLADARTLDELADTLGRVHAKLPMRQAAAESFAWVEAAVAVPWLVELLDEFSSVSVTPDGQAAPQAGRSAELHAELLRALAVHTRAANEPRFTRALDSRSPLVLIEALDAWGTPHATTLPLQMLPPQTLPVQIVSLCDHPMPKVRSRALHALAVHLHPQALPRLIAALDDRDWMARRSAIGGLAVLGDDEALARLEQLLDDSGEMVRAEAVTELAHTRAWQVTDQALGDKSHRVREALAASLAGRRDSTVSAIAEKLIADRAVTVQAAMLTATRGWPNSLAGDVLISGLTSRGGATRHGCRDELLRRWPTAQTLILDVESTLSESTQSEVAVADLRRRWHAEFGDTPPLAQATDTTAGPPLSPQLLRDADALLSRWVAAEQRGEPLEPTQAAWTSLATGPLVVEALGRLVSEHGRTIPNGLYEHVLPRLDSTFEVLSHMTSSDLNERRAAAGELRDRARTQPLSPLVVARLRQVLVYERDALVWQAVLIAIQSDHDQDAMTLASVALGHDQAMIRSQACQHITAAANSEYAHLLVDAITDTDQSVRRAALRGLAFPRSVDDVTPLLRFLADTDVTMRFEAARTLTIIGSPEGFSALERMAHHDDANVRRMVAELMGELAQSRFTATLVQMLDDESRVQRSALASLPSCAGDATPADIHDRGNSQSARVGIWQDWWAKSQPSGDGSLRAARR